MTYTTIISANQLYQQLDQCVVIDCRFNLANIDEGELAYQSGHIPGARYAHLDHHLSSPITAQSGRHPLPDFERFCRQVERWGIEPQSQVVVYDSTGGNIAARLWWLLKAVGHEDVALLDGGLPAWERENYPLSQEIPAVEPSRYPLQPDSSQWCDVEELQQCLQEHACILIDARLGERFRGESEPIDPVAGHIPGSVNQPIALNLDEQGCFKNATELRKLYAPHIKNNKPQQIINTCGSGVFACHAILAIEIAGLGRTRLYPGSWSEWIRDTNRPIAVD